MALKILSGLIAPDAKHRKQGSAKIDFDPHSLSGDIIQPSDDDIQQIGPSGRYTGSPAKSTRFDKFSTPAKPRRPGLWVINTRTHRGAMGCWSSGAPTAMERSTRSRT